MDCRIDQREDPDGRGDVTDTGPHAHHGAGVVVSLQGRALLALGQDNRSIQHFVELGQVEDPAQVGQSLIPHPTDIGRVRHSAVG